MTFSRQTVNLVIIAMVSFSILFSTTVVYGESLGIKQLLMEGLRNNRLIRQKRLERDLFRYDIDKTLGEFDPLLSWTVMSNGQKEPSVSQLAGAAVFEAEDNQANLTLSRKDTLGIDYGLVLGYSKEWSNSSFVSVNPAYNLNAQLSLEIPLLAGNGEAATLADRKLAELEYVSADKRLMIEVEDYILSLRLLYWEAYAIRAELEAAREAEKYIEELYRQVRELVETGRRTLRDRLQVEAEWELARSDRLGSLTALRNVLDQVDVLVYPERLNQPRSEEIPVFQDLPLMVDTEPLPPVFEDIKTALAGREEMQLVEIEDKSNNVLLEKFRNEVRPTVNLVLSGGYEGTASDRSAAWRMLKTGDFYSWQAGVEGTYIFGNHTSRASLEQAELKKKSIEATRAVAAGRIKLDLRRARREILTARDRVISAEKVLEFNREVLRVERVRYDSGRGTVRDILSARKDLTTARARLARARTELMKRYAEYDRALGRGDQFIEIEETEQ